MVTDSKRIDVASIRREQIIESAVGIIVEQGLHNLSLSKIEQRARMKRGQLTYYFPTKEDILLAVFDRLLLLMFERLGAKKPDPHETIGIPAAWDCVQHQLQIVLAPERIGPEFHSLQYTFLAQIAHRTDFRERLASLYEEWRTGLAVHWQVTAKPQLKLANQISNRTISSFVQAIMHGLSVQLAADPNAFDRQEMLELCIGILAPLFINGEPEKPKHSKTSQGNPNRRNGKAFRSKESSQ
jgi:AcrR family transcriptional regulator